ncbi:CotO family spore coat protein [Virgibacillus sediminis]|uniref:CotO family spore coat protein n=1 Tax=Virgibacillus sediminis TaxID=202260 RepID=A0ABV7A9X5_9BACI
MGKRRFAKEPLLYIHQPSIGRPEAKMQYDYSTPKKAQSEKVASEEQGNTSIAKIRGDFLEEEQKALEEMGKEVEQKKEKEPVKANEDDSSENNKSFREMSIPEKADYLAEDPKFTPKKKCEVKTEERRHRGIITQVKDGIVYMRTGNRSRELTMEEIKDIRIIGF